jgi:NAD(P)H dehydrogenase (quinone)
MSPIILTEEAKSQEPGEMSNERYLITGATGATGSAAVRQLLEHRQNVRAFVHREDERSETLRASGAEVYIGDLQDFDAVREALEGIDRAYFVYPIRPGLVQATAQFAQCAKESGVDVIVNMSQISARRDAKSHSARDHWLAERVFDWSGIATTHIRPTFFAEWLLYLAPTIRQGTMRAPFTTGRHAPIAAEDQARVIVGILRSPKAHRGKVYPLFGAVELTHEQIAQAVGEALGREIAYQSMPIESWAELVSKASAGRPPRNDAASLYSEADRITGRPGSEFLIQHLRQVAIDHTKGVFAGTNDLVQRIGGRPPLTVQEFVAKHRDEFTQ